MEACNSRTLGLVGRGLAKVLEQLLNKLLLASDQMSTGYPLLPLRVAYMQYTDHHPWCVT